MINLNFTAPVAHRMERNQNGSEIGGEFQWRRENGWKKTFVTDASWRHQRCERASHFFLLVLKTSAVGALHKDPKLAGTLYTLYKAIANQGS